MSVAQALSNMLRTEAKSTPTRETYEPESMASFAAFKTLVTPQPLCRRLLERPGPLLILLVLYTVHFRLAYSSLAKLSNLVSFCVLLCGIYAAWGSGFWGILRRHWNPCRNTLGAR